MFSRGGEYLIAVDYVSGLRAESKSIRVTVDGPAQESRAVVYPQEGVFDGYSVSLDQGLLLSGEPGIVTYRIGKDGNDVTDLAPYLGAAMHVAAVSDDLGTFIHTHGEVHPLGSTPSVQHDVSVHQHLPPPAHFGPVVEAHLTFPKPGRYTLFSQFSHEGKVIVTRFTVEVL
jgi:hypothetical protein